MRASAWVQVRGRRADVQQPEPDLAVRSTGGLAFHEEPPAAPTLVGQSESGRRPKRTLAALLGRRRDRNARHMTALAP